MVLYHIHRAPLPQLPKGVRSRIRKELDRWTAQNAGVLELNPALLGAFVHARSDWSPEARAMFAYFGIAALVALGVVVAVEAGLVAGAVTLSSGAAALVESAPAARVQRNRDRTP